LVKPTDDPIRFETCTIDRRARLLTIDGKAVKLHDKALSLLLYLIDHRERAVSRGEILRGVWPGVTVADNNVTVQLSKVREALRLIPGGDRLIVTGDAAGEPSYRFVGPVALVLPETPVVPEATTTELGRRPRWRLLLIAFLFLLLPIGLALWRLAMPPPAAQPRLYFAVLPFRNLGIGSTQDYLADLITDDVVAGLVRVPGARVVSRQAAEAVQNNTPPEICQALHVHYIVRGSITPEGGPYHIYAELIEAETGTTLAAWSFDRPRAGIADLRAEIVGFITTKLNLTVNHLRDIESRTNRPANPDAYDLLFQARSLMDHEQTLEAYNRTQSLLEQAIRIQPDFTEAKAELGWRLLLKTTNFDDPNDASDYAEARRRISEALHDAPDNSTALAAYARELMLDGKCDTAVQVASRVASFEPSNVRVRNVLASCARISLRFDDAITQYEELMRLEPDSAATRNRHLAIGMLLLLQDKPHDALVHLQQCQDDQPASHAMDAAEQCRVLFIAAEDLAGEREAARLAYQAYKSVAPGRTTWRLTAYFQKNERKLPSFLKMLAALNDAGMPEYAPEEAVAPTASAVEAAPGTAPACGQGDFAPTPQSLPPPGRVIDTAGMLRHLQTVPPPLVLDFGRHRVQFPGAVNFTEAAREGEHEPEFAVRLAREHLAANHGAPLIVTSDGTTGCAPYLAALRLLSDGYAGTLWYRGGEEAWARYHAQNTEAKTHSTPRKE
jgi:TolB-like protein/DNA-binding winged helix-turn-helix (wHTH) protein/Flp pilus assembly protein TadD